MSSARSRVRPAEEDTGAATAAAIQNKARKEKQLTDELFALYAL